MSLIKQLVSLFLLVIAVHSLGERATGNHRNSPPEQHPKNLVLRSRFIQSPNTNPDAKKKVDAFLKNMMDVAKTGEAGRLTLKTLIDQKFVLTFCTERNWEQYMLVNILIMSNREDQNEFFFIEPKEVVVQQNGNIEFYANTGFAEKKLNKGTISFASVFVLDPKKNMLIGGSIICPEFPNEQPATTPIPNNDQNSTDKAIGVINGLFNALQSRKTALLQIILDSRFSFESCYGQVIYAAQLIDYVNKIPTTGGFYLSIESIEQVSDNVHLATLTMIGEQYTHLQLAVDVSTTKVISGQLLECPPIPSDEDKSNLASDFVRTFEDAINTGIAMRIESLLAHNFVFKSCNFHYSRGPFAKKMVEYPATGAVTIYIIGLEHDEEQSEIDIIIKDADGKLNSAQITLDRTSKSLVEGRSTRCRHF